MIRQAEVYAPDYLGKRYSFSEDKIIAIEDSIEGGFSGVPLEEIDGTGLLAVPGFIDLPLSYLRRWRGGAFRAGPEVKCLS